MCDIMMPVSWSKCVHTRQSLCISICILYTVCAGYISTVYSMHCEYVNAQFLCCMKSWKCKQREGSAQVQSKRQLQIPLRFATFVSETSWQAHWSLMHSRAISFVERLHVCSMHFNSIHHTLSMSLLHFDRSPVSTFDWAGKPKTRLLRSAASVPELLDETRPHRQESGLFASRIHTLSTSLAPVPVLQRNIHLVWKEHSSNQIKYSLIFFVAMLRKKGP